MYRPEEMPLPVFDESEIARWPEAYRHKYYALGGGHEAIGMYQLGDADWQRIRAFYYGMVSLIDKNVGRLLGVLEAQGRLDDTIVVFTTDHGENLGDHHLLFKGTTYDPVTRVPFIVSWVGNRTPGAVREALCSSIDIMPTLLELVGVPCREPCPAQGASLVPVLRGEERRVRDAVLIENAGVRRSVRTEDALLTWHGPATRGELYDLAADPDCLRNLWGDRAASGLQEVMLNRLIELMAENVDPLPVREGPW
jgi:arylsulfatase A-like enzyme